MSGIRDLMTMYVAHRRTFESNIHQGFQIAYRFRKFATDIIEITGERLP